MHSGAIFYLMKRGQDSLARVTLKHLAEQSGYSLRTVKKVMSGTEYVSEETRTSILHIARKLNYKPNRIASTLARNREYKIAVVYAEVSKYYFPEVEAGMRRCLEEHNDFGIKAEFHKYNDLDVEWMKGTLKALAKREDIHGVVVKPVSVDQLDEEINALAAAGKPVVTFGTDAPKSERICYVGIDAYKSGRIAAQLAANYMGKQGKVLIVSMSNTMMQSAGRVAGFKEKMAEAYPAMDLQEVLLPNHPRVYYDSVKSILTHETGITGIFDTSADVYICASVLKELGKKDEIVLIGYDLSEETNKLLKEDHIKAVLYQNPEYQGYQSLKVLCSYFLENKLPQNPNLHPEVGIVLGECL